MLSVPVSIVPFVCIFFSSFLFLLFFFNDTATTEIYTLSLHDALPILNPGTGHLRSQESPHELVALAAVARCCVGRPRSEEHTSELQSRGHLVCRLLLEKKKKKIKLTSSN